MKRAAGQIGLALLLVAAVTGVLLAVSRTLAVDRITIVYLIPVLVAATRWGVVPAVAAAIAGVGATAFFFYAPIYDFRVSNPEQVIELALFVFVAVVTGQLATSLRQAKIRAEAETLREAFIGSVSHELRTPLSSILGSASILAEHPEIAHDPRLASLVRVLKEEAAHLDNEIQNLLDATRITSEGLRPHVEWVDPGDIINAAVGRKRGLLAAHPLRIAVPYELPLLRVDPLLVEKALGHFLENAAKYSKPGSPIELEASHVEPWVRIAVTDFGVGISADEQKRIWERFYRGQRHRGAVPGSGLGLWVAGALIRASGGRVEAFSAGVGRGATFAMLLPVEAPPDSPRLEAGDE